MLGTGLILCAIAGGAGVAIVAPFGAAQLLPARNASPKQAAAAPSMPARPPALPLVAVAAAAPVHLTTGLSGIPRRLAMIKAPPPGANAETPPAAAPAPAATGRVEAVPPQPVPLGAPPDTRSALPMQTAVISTAAGNPGVATTPAPSAAGLSGSSTPSPAADPHG